MGVPLMFSFTAWQPHCHSKVSWSQVPAEEEDPHADIHALLVSLHKF